MEQDETQEGVVQEATSETPSVEEQPTSKRTEEEFRKMQSMKDKAEALAQQYEQSVQSVQRELQELRDAREKEKLEAQRKELEALEGDPDAQAAVRARYRLETERKELQRERSEFESWKREGEGALTRKWNQAAELVEKYNLAPADFASLFSEATTPKEMELMAQVKSEKKKPQSLPKPDSGTSDVGGSDDESFLKAYSEGRSDDHKRAMQLMQKLK